MSAEPYSYERYDPELLALIPRDVEIVRVRGRDLWQAIQGWRGKKFQATIAKSSGEVAQQMMAAQYAPHSFAHSKSDARRPSVFFISRI